MKKLTKKQVIEDFKENILPWIQEAHEQDGIADRPARREGFNNYVDSLQKDGMITERLADNICIPDYLETKRV